MTQTLFAERFAIPPAEEDELTHAVYDERLRYSVAPDGRPYVELDVIGETATVTRADSEPSDDDREWTRVLSSTETVTKAQKDADRWPL